MLIFIDWLLVIMAERSLLAVTLEIILVMSRF